MTQENNTTGSSRPFPSLMGADGLALEGAEIARRSHEYIDGELADREFAPGHKAIVRRIVHATADFSFADSVRIHPDAVENGCAALTAGRPVICDVNMVRAGITSIDSEVICLIKDLDVIEFAKKNATTRAAAAMEKLRHQLEGSIVVVGNAPTALFKLIEIAKDGGPKPALIIGTPVGFVGARESKLALIESGLCYISNVDNKGGSPVAAAAMNALAHLRKESK